MENQELNNNDQALAPFMNKAVGKNALNFGLLTGAVLIIVSLIIYLVGQFGNRSLSNIGFLFLIVGIVYGVWYYKMKVNEGFLSIGKGVATGTLIAVWAGLLSAVYTILLMTVIDPGLTEEILALAEEEILRQNPEIGDAEYEMAMSFTRRLTNPWFTSIMALIFYAIVGLIVSLIASAIMKKEPETIS